MLKEQAAVQLRKQSLGNAAFIYGQIVTAAPNDSEAWRRLADIWLAIPPDQDDDGSERYREARTAAYIAYTQAKTPKGQAAALGSLANAFAKGSEWRPALNALRLATTLDDDPARTIVLAVDRANTPATALYKRQGFRFALRRVAMVQPITQVRK